ncbi:MAG: ABC transporter permease [Candidatus Marinimicrobia bacterium]|nr:ABC transporter permease [Candidatus Neomarinimicrobiota bacterium]
MSYAAYIARRYLFGRHRIKFIAFIARTSILGLALGVTALVLSVSILHGFKSEVTRKIIGFDAHLRVENLYGQNLYQPERMMRTIDTLAGVKRVFPILRGEVMLRANDATDGAIFEGLPEEALPDLYSVSGTVVAGNTNLGSNGLLMGKTLADRPNVAVGDQLLLYNLETISANSPLPFVQIATVRGIYASGMVDYDKAYIYGSYDLAQSLFESPDQASAIGISLHDIRDTQITMADLSEHVKYPDLVLSWEERHQTLFNWIKTQQLPIITIFSLIILIALVNVTSTLILIILEKTQEIGILKSLGTPRMKIMVIFALKGLYIGAIGAGIGLVLSLGFGWLQIHYQIIPLPTDVYFMDAVPIRFVWRDVALIAGGAVMFSVLATTFPAWKAGRIQPADALRSE